MAQLQFRGYLENRFFITFLNNDFAASHLKNSMRFGDYNRARVIMSRSVSNKSSLTLGVDYFTYHGYIQQQLRQTGAVGDSIAASIDQRIAVDRAYIRLYFSRADVTIGKQRVSWGRSLLWSPFDVFNRVNFFEPQEEKFGINAIRITVPTGTTSMIEGVFSPKDRIDKSSAGIRALWNWRSVEFVVAAIHYVHPLFRQNIYGFEWKGDKEVGIWFEGAYFNEKPVDSGILHPVNYFRWLVGVDYSFDIGNGLYLMAEYTHDESGEPDKTQYNYSYLFTGRRFLLARDYMYGSVQFRYSDLTSLSTTILANVNDRSVFLMPGISYLIFPDSELRLGMFLALTEDGSEFNPLPVDDPYNRLGNSALYAWLKVYF
ncbi:hypothetical protein AMJ80_09315 [bacterium SM23_31]|nr:MAG: hypothetical protein AMJ80_09315 [bacterium SM23_31]